MTTQALAPLRILHAPWNIAGQPSGLARAERALGADSRSVALLPSASFPADETLWDPKSGGVRRELARAKLLWRALRHVDVVHLYFGHSLLSHYLAPEFLPQPQGPAGPLKRAYARALWLADLPLLKAFGKTVVMTWQGDDARQGDTSRALFDISIAGEVDPAYYAPAEDRGRRRAIAALSRFVDQHFALNPDLLHVLPSGARFLPYASFPIADHQPAWPGLDRDRPLRIVHAPSHRGAKGTRFILDAVAALRREGQRFDFELVEGLARAEAVARYREADVVVDQLLAGWYGGLAVEAMALGKPVVAYIRPGDLPFLPADMRAALPVVQAAPDTIEQTLRSLITMPPADLQALAKASRSFVEQWHAPEAVARTTLREYRRLIG